MDVMLAKRSMSLYAQYVHRGLELLGYVFYDEASANGGQAGRDLVIHFGQIEHPLVGKAGVITKQVGRIVGECLDSFNVPHVMAVERGMAVISGDFLRKQAG